jgi:eukaryotic-like serine/threonine-protein kinase
MDRPPPMSVAPGTRLGPYEIVSPIGAGGMGQVWRALDTRLRRAVAIKVLPDALAYDPQALARFEREARAVAALSHPNILAIFDVGEAGGVRYVVTELLEGETLRAALQRGTFPLLRALEVSAQVARALAAAYGKGIVHRDVKPENVFLTNDGGAKLLDFGLTRQIDPPSDPNNNPTATNMTDAGTVLGTVAYMSPEQARGRPVDHRSDQFSLGIVLYELLAGRRPFHGESAAETVTAIIREAPEPLATAAPLVSAPVRMVVERCLAKEPGGRYESTRDLARDLEAWREQGLSASTGVTGDRGGRGRLPSGRRLILAMAAALVLALLAVGGWYRKERAKGAAGSLAAVSGATPAAASALEPKRVVVAVFENRTGDPSLDPVGRMSAEWITDGLSRAGIEVIPSSYAAEVAARADPAKSPGRDPGLALAEATGSGSWSRASTT